MMSQSLTACHPLAESNVTSTLFSNSWTLTSCRICVELKKKILDIENIVEAHEEKQKDLVKFIAHQTCINPHTVRQLIRTLELKEKVSDTGRFQEEPQPSILTEALSAPDPVAMATQAIEERNGC